MIKRLGLAALIACAALVTVWPATAATSPHVRIVSMTPAVGGDDQARLVAKVTPANAKCSITVYLRSGPSKASGLYPKRAVNGRVSWKWNISRQTTDGKWPVYVKCGTAIAKTVLWKV
jgi:hypothetical protein